jgi:hypothetical protein
MKSLLTYVVAAVVMSLCIGSVASVVSWSDDFETPPYALGPIDGQNGWSATSSNPTVIADGTAPSGSQVLQMAGQAQNGNATVSFADATTDLVKVTAYFDGATYVTSHAAMMIRSGSTYAVWAKFQESYGEGWGFYNIYGNTSQYAGADGAKLVWNAGTWQKVELWLDLANDEFAVKINDVTINEWYNNGGALIDTHTWTPFNNNISSFNAVQLFVTIADNAGATPFKVDALLVEEGDTELPPDPPPPPPPLNEYETSFEAVDDPSGDTFTVGPLNGQAGWQANNDTASVVQTTFVDSGSQAVRVSDSSNQDYHNLYKIVDPMYDFADSIIRVEMSIKPPGYYTSNPTVILRDDSEQEIFWMVFTDGTGYTYGNIKVDGQLDYTDNPDTWDLWRVTFGEWSSTKWHKLAFDIDLANQSFDILLDDYLTNCIDLSFLVNEVNGGTNIINNVTKLWMQTKTGGSDMFLDEVKFRFIPRPLREFETSFETSEGFVLGDLNTQNRWYGRNQAAPGNPTDKVFIQSAVKRTGEYAVEVGDTSDPFSDVYEVTRNISGYDTGIMYVDFFLKPPAYYTSNPTVFFSDIGGDASHGYDNNTDVCRLKLIDGTITDNGSVQIDHGATNTQLDGTWWRADQWVRFTLAFDLDNRQFDVLINGDAIDSLTNLEYLTDSSGDTSIAEKVKRIIFSTKPGYVVENSFATPLYIDDVRVSDTPWNPWMPSGEITITDTTSDTAGVTIEWESLTGNTYSVHWKDDMTGGWTKAADVAGAGGLTTDWIDTGGPGRTDPRDSSVTKRFYLVEEQ